MQIYIGLGKEFATNLLMTSTLVLVVTIVTPPMLMVVAIVIVVGGRSEGDSLEDPLFHRCL